MSQYYCDLLVVHRQGLIKAKLKDEFIINFFFFANPGLILSSMISVIMFAQGFHFATVH